MAHVKIPYFKWRDGRPRWEPGPGLRARGMAGRDLKDGAGNWLNWGAAIEECKRINAGADKDAAKLEAASAANVVRNVSNLIALYKKSPNFLRLRASTQSGYRSNLSIIEEWAGDHLVAAITKANIANWHMAQEELRGAPMANGLLRTWKIILYYALDDLEWITKVRARKVRMAKADGRLVIWPMPAIAGYVAWADYVGRPDLGDAVILGAMAGQRRADTLKLPRGKDLGGIYRFKTGKTGREVKVPAVRQLVARLNGAHARTDRLFPNVEHLTELVDVTTGASFHPGGTKFHKDFLALKRLAAGEHDALDGGWRALAMEPHGANAPPYCPDLASLLFQDLRDTAVTWLAMAGCNKFEIATVTGHSLATIDKILEKHYFVRDDSFAHSAGVKLEAFLTKANFG